MTTISNQQYNKKIILVTGASRGFGYYVALKAASTGGHIIITARTQGGLENLADKIVKAGSSVTIAPMDLCNENNVQLLFRSIFDKFGKLDFLIHCSSLAVPLTPVHNLDKKDLRRYFDSNVICSQQLIKMAHPLMKKSKRSVLVFIDDRNHKSGQKYLGIYNAVKGASRELFRAYAEERKRLGPKVIIFEPKAMPTGTRLVMYPGEDKKALTSIDEEASRLINLIADYL